MESVIFVLVAALGGGTLGTFGTKFLDRRKDSAETVKLEAESKDILARASETVLSMMEQQIKKMAAQLTLAEERIQMLEVELSMAERRIKVLENGDV
jgi:hypothetical protein